MLLVIGEDIRKRESILVTEIIDKTDRLILFAQLIAKLLRRASLMIDKLPSCVQKLVIVKEQMRITFLPLPNLLWQIWQEDLRPGQIRISCNLHDWKPLSDQMESIHPVHTAPFTQCI